MTDGIEFGTPADISETSHLRRAFGASMHIVSSLVVIAINQDTCEVVKAALSPSKVA